MSFIKELKERKVRKYFTIYVSTCITAIGLTHLFSLRYSLPTFFFDTLLVFIIFGILTLIIIAWNHGKEGAQKIKIWEYIVHIIIIGSAFSVSILLANRGPIKILPLNSKTVAVLPFTNMSDSKSDRYFSDGITEDILTQLSKISELRVISRTSVMKYRNTRMSIPEIGRKLGAGSILEGSVRRSGNKVRIIGQLINSSSDEHIWAETFDRKIDDIFDVQSEIAKHIAKELEAQLAPKEEILIETKPTNNIEAYAFCLKGRSYASKYSDEDNNKAIEYYKKALSIDSNYSLAYAGIAAAYDQKVRRYFYPEEWQDSAIMMSNKALSIDPNLAEGHSSLAKSYEAEGDYKLAKYHYEKAIRLNPNYYAAIYNLGIVYFNEGSIDKAFELIRESIQLEPDNVFGYIVTGGIFQKFVCDSIALVWFNKALELEPENLLAHIYITDQYILMNDLLQAEYYVTNMVNISPEWPYGLLVKAKLNVLKGNFKNALSTLNKALSITGGNKEYDYAYSLSKINKENAAQSILIKEANKYLDEIDNKSVDSYSNESNLANIYGILQDDEKALEWLKKAVAKGLIEYKQFLVYPYLEPLKNNSEFIRLIDMMKARVDSMKIIARDKDPDWFECK